MECTAVDNAVRLKLFDESVASVFPVMFEGCFGWLHES